MLAVYTLSTIVIKCAIVSVITYRQLLQQLEYDLLKREDTS